MAKKTELFPSTQEAWAIQCEGVGIVYPTLADSKNMAIAKMTHGGTEDWRKLKHPKGCYRAVKVRINVIDS